MIFGGDDDDYDLGNYFPDSGWLDDEIPPVIKPRETPKCECGAHATKFPTFHSDWCPMSKHYKPKPKDDGKRWF